LFARVAAAGSRIVVRHGTGPLAVLAPDGRLDPVDFCPDFVLYTKSMPKRRKMGRPRTGHDPVFAIRLPTKLVRKIDRLAEALSLDRSKTVRRLLEEGVYFNAWLLQSHKGKGVIGKYMAVTAASERARAAAAAVKRARPKARIAAEIKAHRARPKSWRRPWVTGSPCNKLRRRCRHRRAPRGRPCKGEHRGAGAAVGHGRQVIAADGARSIGGTHASNVFCETPDQSVEAPATPRCDGDDRQKRLEVAFRQHARSSTDLQASALLNRCR
jgi:hypothetical protein